MIQLHFHPQVPISSQFLKPAPPSKPQSHHRPQSFSSRILKHGGPARDTTIQATTKAAARQKTQFTKTFSQMDDIMSEFAAEMALVESMKKELVTNQQRMASTSLQWYSALTIQQYYRRVCSRFLLKKLKKGRLISNWVYFRSYYRKRCRRAVQLTRWARSWWTRRKFLTIIRANIAARKIQKRFKNRRNFRVLLMRIQILRAVKKFQAHAMLFSTTRARRKILQIRYPVPPEVDKLKPFRSFMMSCLRKRRLRLLRSNQGKLTFYILSMFYHDPNDQCNHIIEYVKRKIGRSFDPPGSSGSTFNHDRATSSSSSTSANGKKFLLTTRGRTTPRGVTSGFGSPTTATPQPTFSAKDLPAVLVGFFRLRSVYDTYLLIKDMIKVALANPILVDDSILPAPVNSSARLGGGLHKKLQRKGKNTDSSSALTPANALLSPNGKGGANKGNKYGSNNNKGSKNTKVSGGNRLNQHALDEMNNRNSKGGTSNHNRNTSRNIKTPNSVLSNESRSDLNGIEYENTDSSEDDEGDNGVVSNPGSFSSPPTGLRKSTEANGRSSYHSPIAVAVAATAAAVGSESGSGSNAHGLSSCDPNGTMIQDQTNKSKRLASIEESTGLNASASVVASPDINTSHHQTEQHSLHAQTPIAKDDAKDDASLLSIKTDILSSSLTYSDAGSDLNSSMTRIMDSSAFDTPFKNLSMTTDSMSMSLTTPLSQQKANLATSTISSNMTSFYIAGKDSDSDFEIELSDAEIQALLSPK